MATSVAEKLAKRADGHNRAQTQATKEVSVNKFEEIEVRLGAIEAELDALDPEHAGRIRDKIASIAKGIGGLKSVASRDRERITDLKAEVQTINAGMEDLRQMVEDSLRSQGNSVFRREVAGDMQVGHLICGMSLSAVWVFAAAVLKVPGKIAAPGAGAAFTTGVAVWEAVEQAKMA